MQRRHFELIAVMLRDAPFDSETREKVTEYFAEQLSRTNSSFRRDYFMSAATGGDYHFKSIG